MVFLSGACIFRAALKHERKIGEALATPTEII